MTNITDLRKKRERAVAAFERHRYTNGTNNVEAAFEDIAIDFLKRYFSDVKGTGHSWLNYLGVDFICLDDKGDATTVDLKVCQNLEKMDFLVDAWKKTDSKDKDYNEFALDQKANEYFLFINKNIIALVPFNVVYEKTKQLEKKDCFFMKRDLYHTTMKAIIHLESKDCTYIRRRSN